MLASQFVFFFSSLNNVKATCPTSFIIDATDNRKEQRVTVEGRYLGGVTPDTTHEILNPSASPAWFLKVSRA